MSSPAKLPRWAELALLPVVNLLAALLVSGAIILLLGESPWAALKLMAAGSLGSQEGVGYTLYYATNFMFTGLAVAVAYHAGLFNIGGEGQASSGDFAPGWSVFGSARGRSGWCCRWPCWRARSVARRGR